MTVRRSDTRAPWRAALAHQTIRFLKGLGLALTVATAIQCSDAPSTAPQIQLQKRATLRLQPSFAALPAGAPTIDLAKIRGVLLGANGDSVVTEALFQGDSAILVFTVQFTGTTGTFKVDITAYDRTGQVAFHGVDTVTVRPGNNPPLAPPPMRYAGPDAGVTRIAVVPGSISMDVGTTAGLAVTGYNAAGQAVNAPVRAAWQSRAPGVASVDGASGLVTAGAAEGSTWIVATSVTGASDSARVQVHAPVASFTVTPNPAQVVRGDSVQLVPVMKDAAGNPITGRTIIWSINDQTVATVSATGKVRGIRLGSATVSALVEGRSVDVPVTVVSPVDHITATPNPMTFASFGEQQPLSITVVPKNNASLAGVPTTVSVADPTIVSIDDSHTVTALRNGATTITIKADVATLVVPVTVRQAVKTLTVSPKTYTAQSQGEHIAFTATVTDANGNPVAGVTPTWVSTNTAVVTSDAKGAWTTVNDGTALVIATAGAVADTATVTVHRVPVRLSITLPKSVIAVGEAMIASAAIVDANGYPFPTPITWRSSNTSIIVVDGGGGVTGVAPGTANIQASGGGMSTGTGITVAANGGNVTGRVVDATTGYGIAGALLTSGGAHATSASDGSYALAGVAQGGSITASATGYVSATMYNVQVSPGQTTQVDNFQLVPSNPNPGAVSGTVVSSITGSGIANATVSLYAGIGQTTGSPVRTTLTNSYGGYSITELAAGTYTISVTAPGYAAGFITGIVVGGGTRGNQNLALAPVTNSTDLRIVLDWGSCRWQSPPGNAPCDLDSHLWGPTATGGRFEVAYYNRSYGDAISVADLDRDDTDGQGPETVTISQQAATGTYHYLVHNYSGEFPLSQSQARVRVYRGSALLATFYVPNGGGRYWDVFTLVGNTVTPVNRLVSSMPYPSSLAPFAGGAPNPTVNDLPTAEQQIRSHVKRPGKPQMP